MKHCVLACLLLVAGRFVAAADITVPNLTETGGISSPLNTDQRIYQEYFDPSNFSAITLPMLLTGLQFRLGVGNVSWPPEAVTFANYKIELSVASAQLVADGGYTQPFNSIASYEGPNLTTVRNGPLSFSAGAFPSTGNPNPWGPAIGFTTPYVFNPGDSLLLTITHTGWSPNVLRTQVGAAAGPNTPGVASAIAVFTSSPFASGPVLVNFQTAPVPEVSTVWLFCIGALTGIALRRVRCGL